MHDSIHKVYNGQCSFLIKMHSKGIMNAVPKREEAKYWFDSRIFFLSKHALWGDQLTLPTIDLGKCFFRTSFAWSNSLFLISSPTIYKKKTNNETNKQTWNFGMAGIFKITQAYFFLPVKKRHARWTHLSCKNHNRNPLTISFIEVHTPSKSSGIAVLHSWIIVSRTTKADSRGVSDSSDSNVRSVGKDKS